MSANDELQAHTCEKLLEFYGDVANANSQDLTEQWKKGELPDGMYYMENTSGIIGMVGHSKVFPCYNVKQILAPVPSYKEWQAKNEENKNLYKMLDVLNGKLDSLLKEDNENQQLKELLKECMNMFVKMYETNTVNSVFLGLYENIKTKIDNAIGEKK